MPTYDDYEGRGPEPLSGLRNDIQTLIEKVEDLGPRASLERLLTREEAAERLRISTRTLDDMEAAGEIQAVRVRGRVLYHPETLEAFIRRCSREGRE